MSMKGMRKPRMTKRPNDFVARQEALDPNRSFICEAPAGSGKTELLTQRFLVLLAKAKKPEEILAITFTRKAAGEMRERVLKAIVAAKQNPCPQEAHQRQTWEIAKCVLETSESLNWQLLDNPNRLQIRTFDSLCSHLAASLPLYSAFGGTPDIAEEPEELYRQAVHDFIATLEQDVAWASALITILTQLDNHFARLENLLVDMLARREAWLPLFGSLGEIEQSREIKGQLETHLQHVREDLVSRLHREIPQSEHQLLLDLAAYAAANLRSQNIKSIITRCLDIDFDNESLPKSDTKGISQWIGLVTLLTTKEGKWRSNINRRQGFPKGENQPDRKVCAEKKRDFIELVNRLKQHDGLLELLLEMRYLPAANYDSDQWELLQAITQVLPVLAAHLTLVFREKNKVDFPEITLRARSALGQLETPTELALRLDYRIQHILVDEFQDTSIAQVELLEKLTAGWQVQDGRTLFCVGDAMQSIYGFRGANVGLFLHCRANGLGNIPLVPIQLTTNFRSNEKIVQWINQRFMVSFPSHNDIGRGAVRFSPATTFHSASAAKAVWVHGFVRKEQERREADEARIILGIVRKSLLDNPLAKIAILVRNRNHAAHILPVLKDANVKYRAVDLEPLSDVVVIQDLMALTHALLFPADRTAWMSVLRAPWCGLSLIDLEAIANFATENRRYPIFSEQLRRCLAHQSENLQGNPPEIGQVDMFTTLPVKPVNTPVASVGSNDVRADFRQLTSDGLKRLTRVAPILFDALENAHRKNLRQFIEGVWIKLGGPACLSNPSDLQDAQVFFELLEKLDDAGKLAKNDSLTQAVKKLFATPDPDSNDQLQIMTIHKSKGLEFDVVIIPSLQRTPKRNDSELLIWQERIASDGHAELIMSPIPPSHKESDRDFNYQYLREEQKKREQLESCRLLYVACTRAKDQLHLLATVKEDKSDSLHLLKPAKSSLLATIWKAIETRIKRYDATKQIVQQVDMAPKPKYLQRLPNDWQLPNLKEGEQLKQYVIDSTYDREKLFEDPAILDSSEHRPNDNLPDLVWHNPAPKNIGTLVHRILQDMGEQGLSAWQQRPIESQRPYWRASLANLGTPLSVLDGSLKRVESIVRKVLDDEIFTWMHDNNHHIKYCEYPVSLTSYNQVQHLVIDLLIETVEGDTWIIDYKTSEPESGQNQQEFLYGEIQQYRSALKNYTVAAKKLGFKRIKTALYFPLLQKLEEVMV